MKKFDAITQYIIMFAAIYLVVSTVGVIKDAPIFFGSTDAFLLLVAWSIRPWKK